MQSENEIYGWLLGYQKDKIPIISALLECKRFDQQSLISAIPQAEEFQEISSIMPQGIGPIGIYHSHPFSSEVFHSHTDDSTLISLSKQFPNCTSIVTNGKDIKYYQMGTEEKTKEISADFTPQKMIKFYIISFKERFCFKIDNDILMSKEDKKKLNIKLFNSLSNILNKIWDELEYFEYGRKIEKTAIIKPYLTKNIEGRAIQIKIPERFKEEGTIVLKLNEEKKEDIKFTQLKLYLKIKIPIYSPTENKIFSNFNNMIKTELLSNNLIQKINSCVIDDAKGKILLPSDHYLNFFGYFIRLVSFNQRLLNRNKLSSRNYQLILKLISLIENFKEMKLNYAIKRHILLSISDIKKFIKKFEWEGQINKEIFKLKKYFNFI